jgi:hypothetical protein
MAAYGPSPTWGRVCAVVTGGQPDGTRVNHRYDDGASLTEGVLGRFRQIGLHILELAYL